MTPRLSGWGEEPRPGKTVAEPIALYSVEQSTQSEGGLFLRVPLPTAVFPAASLLLKSEDFYFMPRTGLTKTAPSCFVPGRPVPISMALRPDRPARQESASREERGGAVSTAVERLPCSTVRPCAVLATKTRRILFTSLVFKKRHFSVTRAYPSQS